MSRGMLGIFQNAGGINAYPSGSLASQTKKKTRMGQLRRNGTRKPAVLKPFDAPRVSPRMRRIFDTSMVKHPTRSRRLNLSRAVYSAPSPVVFGTNTKEANAKGTITMVIIRKNCHEHDKHERDMVLTHRQAAFCPPAVMKPKKPAITRPACEHVIDF